LEWNVYCFDRPDFNTAGAHLMINPESITILTAGFYRISYHSISLGAVVAAVEMLRNGQAFHAELANPGGDEWYWRKGTVDIVWPFAAGDVLQVRAWNPGLYAYSYSGPNGQYSRFQMQFVGPTQ
jgi:hypothetical protein